MKKILFLTILMLSILSTAFATFNLNENRWKYVGSNKDFKVYYDKESLNIDKLLSTYETWVSFYYPEGVSSCGSSVCKNKGLDLTEHYHFVRFEINYKAYTSKLKAYILRDKDNLVIDSYTIPLYMQKEDIISSDSLIETVMLTIKNDVEQPSVKKTVKKDDNKNEIAIPEEIGISSILVNNVKQTDLKDLIIKIMKARDKKIVDSTTEAIEKNSLTYVTITTEEEKGKVKIVETTSKYSLEPKGKDILLKMQTTGIVKFSDGTTLGPWPLPDFLTERTQTLEAIKSYFNGWYRMGYDCKTKSSDGFIISEIVPKSAFEEAGIKVGDIVVSINGKFTVNYSEKEFSNTNFRDSFSSNPVEFIIKHDGVTKKYNIKPKYVTSKEVQKDFFNLN